MIHDTRRQVRTQSTTETCRPYQWKINGLRPTTSTDLRGLRKEWNLSPGTGTRTEWTQGLQNDKKGGLSQSLLKIFHHSIHGTFIFTVFLSITKPSNTTSSTDPQEKGLTLFWQYPPKTGGGGICTFTVRRVLIISVYRFYYKINVIPFTEN